MTPRLRFLLILSVIAFTVLPSAAAPPPPPPPFELPPVVSADPLPGPGTVGYRFTAPEGASIGISIDAAFDDASTQGDGLWLYDSDLHLIFGAWGTAIAGGGFEYHVEAPEPIGVLFDRPGTRAAGIGGGSGLIIFGMPAGQYIAFAGAVGDGSFVSATGTLYGSEGTTLQSRSVTEGGFFHREADFRGLNALVGVGGLRARAIVGATLEESVDRFLFGDFSYFGELEIARLTVTGPNGSSSSTFGHLLALEEPGDYRFTVDADVGIGDLQLWGVEAAIPPPSVPTTGA
jgi:hypothetical protein